MMNQKLIAGCPATSCSMSSFLGEFSNICPKRFNLGFHSLHRIRDIRKSIGDIPLRRIRYDWDLLCSFFEAFNSGVNSLCIHIIVFVKKRSPLPMSGEMAVCLYINEKVSSNL